MKSTVFDELTMTLSDEERQRMLSQLRSSIMYSEVTLNNHEEDISTPELSEERIGLTFWERIKIFLLSFIGQENYDDVLKKHLLGKTQRFIEIHYPGWINFNEKRYQTVFCNEIKNLAEAVAIFKRPLNDALSEHRQEFYALLGGEASPSLQRLIIDATDPVKVLKKHPEYNKTMLRTAIETDCNDLLRKILAESRTVVRSYTSMLAHLERLATFNFDKCIALFSKDGSCPASILNKPLKKLNDILFSFDRSPPFKLLETLFLFSYKCQDLTDEKAEEQLKADLKTAAVSLEYIKKFNSFPITKTLRILDENYFYKPNLLSGGEDWANLYQKFWQGRADKAFKFFVFEQKKEQLEQKTMTLFHGDDLPILSNYSDSAWPDDYKAVYKNSIGIISAFLTQYYAGFENNLFLPIKENGNFFRKDNAVSFAQTLELMHNVEDELTKFNKSLSAGGDLYEKIFSSSSTGSQIKENSIAIANRLADTLVKNTIDVLRLLSLLLEGLVKGTSFDGKYDSISNMPEFNHRSTGFSADLQKSYRTIYDVWSLLSDVKDIEERLVKAEQETSEKNLKVLTH
jgi:hypothetical protein